MVCCSQHKVLTCTFSNTVALKLCYTAMKIGPLKQKTQEEFIIVVVVVVVVVGN